MLIYYIALLCSEKDTKIMNLQLKDILDEIFKTQQLGLQYSQRTFILRYLDTLDIFK